MNMAIAVETTDLRNISPPFIGPEIYKKQIPFYDGIGT
jgi:hypothetical protein